MSDAPMVMKWFTRVRRIPTLIGKMPSGERIKGGPYKAAQLVAFGGVLGLSLWSMKWWAKLPIYATGFDGQIYAYATALGLAVAAGLVAKRMPGEGQSVLVVGSGSTRLLTSSSAPRFAGRSAVARPPARPRRQRRITITELDATPQAPAVVEEPAPSLEQQPTPQQTPPAPSQAPTTAQQKLAGLLAQHTTGA